MRAWALLVGIAVSIAVTAALWAAGIPGFFLFLALPLFFFPWGRQKGPDAGPWRGRRCPLCGRFSTDPEERHCKRDGTLMADQGAP